MDSSTAVGILNDAVELLKGWLTVSLPILIPLVIGFTVFFVGLRIVKGLWHSKF